MTNKKVVELDVEFIEYKAEAKASMDALEKKIDDGIGKLDASIKAMKEESDAKFEVLRQLILGTAPSQSTHVNHVPQITKVPAKTAPYVPPIRRTYDDLGFPLPKFQANPSTVIGKNQRSDFIELEDSSSKPVQGKLDHMNDERNRQRTSFGSEFEATGFEPTGFRQPTTVAYGWIYSAERYFEIQELPQQEQLRAAALCMEGEALSWYGIPKGLNDAMELSVSIEDNELYEGVMLSKGVAAIVGQTTSVRRNIHHDRCASSTLQVVLVDESDEAEERDLNFKSWNRGSKID
ncbi:hypothetical protein Tco_0902485 [Tanacetum coccineum]